MNGMIKKSELFNVSVPTVERIQKNFLKKVWNLHLIKVWNLHLIVVRHLACLIPLDVHTRCDSQSLGR